VPRVALTFDDGPGPMTERILDILAAHGARATFFVLGRNVAEAPWTQPPGDAARARALVERMVRGGHVVGNHTFSHAKPDRWLELGDDVGRCDAVLAELGVAAAPVRLPYGIRLPERTVRTEIGTTRAAALDPRVAVLASLGRTHVHWTSDFDDWTLAPGDGPALAARMLQHVEEMASLGLDAVLDLHDGGTGSGFGYTRMATADALDPFLAEIVRRGYGMFVVPREEAKPT